jgi:hypothetical protein
LKKLIAGLTVFAVALGASLVSATAAVADSQVTIPLVGCSTAQVPAPLDRGTSMTYSVRLTGPGTNELAGSGTSTSSVDVAIDFCHGTRVAGEYRADITRTITERSGNTLFQSTSVSRYPLHVTAAVTSSAVSLSGAELNSPTSCGDVAITAAHYALLGDEQWAFELQVLKPGATFWQSLTQASGSGPFSRTTGLYLCPTDPAGTYSIRANYAISDKTASAVVTGVSVSQVVVVAPTVPAVTPVVNPPVSSPVAQPVAKAKSSVSLKVVRHSKTVTVTGVVKVGASGAKGVKVKLQKKVGKKWVTAKTTVSKTGGKVSARLKSTKKVSLRFVISATTVIAGSHSRAVKR